MTENQSEQDVVESILGNITPRGEPADDRSTEEIVLEEFRTEIDPQLVNAGWGFEAAKSVEHGKTDQSLLNHVRNGVFVLAQLNDASRNLGGYTLGEEDLRAAIALFTIHDIHKLNPDRDTDPKTRFDIPAEEVQSYVDRFGLDEFASDLTQKDFRSCAVDHHDDWTANSDQTTRRFDDLRPFVRLADGLASCDTPEAAVSKSIQTALDRTFLTSDFELRYHLLDDVKGILTNLLNSAISDCLSEFGYYPLAIYQDGCVYITSADAQQPSVDEQLINEFLIQLQSNIQNSHDAYADSSELVSNLATRSHGFYEINDQDFFYAGAVTILEAVIRKAVEDADPDDEPTDSMSDSMNGMEKHIPIEIERTRRPVGLARLVYTVRRAFVDPILARSSNDKSSLEVTCEVFGVPDAVRDGLVAAGKDDDLSPTAGGKWEYSYGIGQVLVNDGHTDVVSIAERLKSGLNMLSEDWVEAVETEHTANLQSELAAYVSDVVSINGRPLPDSEESLSDPFEEYHNDRRGKTCVLCNRGTTSTRKSDLEAPKSLTTLQAGYSNHIPVDAGKPDKLLACIPCQIELSLRETGASRRDGGRLFLHLIPDYFYTPLSWRSYSDTMSEFRSESKIELGRLAESILWLTGDLDKAEIDGFESALFDENSGRQMAETLDQGFDPGAQFGAQTLGYFKPQDNETEFQFFGVYVALAVATYAGLRVYISESPIPDIKGRDFQTYARIGAGFSQIHGFYGTEIPLTEMKSQLRAASALISLGYGTGDRTDALFAKFLRMTRNKLLPGSHLLKRIAQSDDGSHARYLLEEARALDQETGIGTTTKSKDSDK